MDTHHIVDNALARSIIREEIANELRNDNPNHHWIEKLNYILGRISELTRRDS